MAEKRPFLLRLDPVIHDALRKWAADDLRSLNGQIEWALRRALVQEGRLGAQEEAPRGDPGRGGDVGNGE